MSAKENQLRITSPNKPLFLASKPGGTELMPGVPLLTGRWAEIVKDIVKSAGMPHLTAYDLRRDIADDFARKLGNDAASLVLGHRDAGASVLTESYSLGPGNLDVLGIRTGEAEDQYLPGTASRVELRLRSGTAICLVSKAIAALAHDQPEEIESDNQPEVESDDEPSIGKAALDSLEKKNKKAVKDARKQAVAENEQIHAANQEVVRRWDLWFQTMVPGSPLYMKFANTAKKQNQINNIKSHDLYVELAQNEAVANKLADREKSLRDAFKALAKLTQKVSRQAADETSGKQDLRT
ncbi:hypothetical protein FRC07_004135 [Ceratobasidium sp. 392]|nr:hypothetical protein FRC07_004135 [Ceratobasidium sp. 392]